jgi:hypothetical protein
MNSTFEHQIHPSTADQVKGRGIDSYWIKISKSQQIPKIARATGQVKTRGIFQVHVLIYEHSSTYEWSKAAIKVIYYFWLQSKFFIYQVA